MKITISNKYRPDIDGLRAIAVILVILFHFGFSQFKGGFVGVDIFFVISGFLITRIIFKEVLETNNFEFSNFYLRRTRRILPALFATLFLSFIVAAFILSPSDFKRFCGAHVASILSVSNFYFWNEAGYFDVLSESKPLLHLWSLGVEEQFYLVWPLLLVGLLIFKKNTVRFFILTIAASLFASIYFQNERDSIFFLPWFRAFEFGIGGILVAFRTPNFSDPNWKKIDRNKNISKEFVLILGLCLVFFPATQFTEQILFPTYNALFPCIGAALVILSGEARFTGLILRNPLSVGIGRISYSLYLFHWPVLVFYKYQFGGDLDPELIFYLFLISLLMAIVSYQFVEMPFRKKDYSSFWKSNRRLVATALTTGILLILPSLHSYFNKGWLWRFPFNISRIIENTNKNLSKRIYLHDNCRSLKVDDMVSGKCLKIKEGKFNILVLGDSVGEFAWHGLRVGLPKDSYNLMQFTPSGCHPIFNIGNEPCENIKKYLFYEILPKNKIDLVVMFSLNWSRKELEETLLYIKTIQQKTILVETSIKFDDYLPNILSKFQPKSNKEIPGLVKDHISNPTLDQRKEIREITEKYNIKYYGIVERICKDETNWESCKFVEDRILLTNDNNHFTPKFAEKIFKELAEDIIKRNY